MTLYNRFDLVNTSSNLLESGTSDLCKDAEASSELFELICDMIEYLDKELARIQALVRTAADEVNLRVTALLILLSTYTPERVEAEVRRLRR